MCKSYFLCQNVRMTKEEKQKQFTQILFRWHKTHYRPMAWRDTRDPYRILVSEIMLQQTQVERVREKYAEFLKRFPNVRKLAESPLGDVLRVWSGLGYNRRAKYLHETAKRVTLRYGGKFPDDIDELLALPGIGISTAAAVSAFAFDRDLPMIDTNVRRILVRVFFRDAIPADMVLYAFAQLMIPKGKGRAWNYAMLDLGAMLCTARNHSEACPMDELHGVVEDFVHKRPQKKFLHSDRFYRGRIVAQLVGGPSTKRNLAKTLGLTAPRIDALLHELLREKLIIQGKGKEKLIRLP